MQSTSQVVGPDGFPPLPNHFSTFVRGPILTNHDLLDYYIIKNIGSNIRMYRVVDEEEDEPKIILNHILGRVGSRVRQYYLFISGRGIDVDINLDLMGYRSPIGTNYFITGRELRRLDINYQQIVGYYILSKNGTIINSWPLPSTLPQFTLSQFTLPLDIHTLPTSGNGVVQFREFPYQFEQQTDVTENILERRLGSPLPYLLIKTNSRTTRILQVVLPSEEQRAILSNTLIYKMNGFESGYRTIADGTNYDVDTRNLAIRPFDDSYIGYFVSTLDPRINQNIFSLNPDRSVVIADLQGRPFVDWPPY